MDFAFRGTDTAAAWDDWHATNAAVQGSSVEIAPAPEPAYGAPEALPTDVDPVDLAVDHCGDCFLLASTGEVHRYDAERDAVHELDCTWRQEAAGDPVAIAATRDTVYLAGASGHLQAYARRLHQTRWTLQTSLASPVALASAGGDALVLDAGDGSDDAGFLARVGSRGSIERVVEDLTAPRDVAWAAGTTHLLSGGPDGAVVATYGADFGATGSIAVPDDLDPACLAAEPDGDPVLGVGPGAAGDPAPVRIRDDEFHRLDGSSGATSTLVYASSRDRDAPEGLYAVLGEPLVAEGRRAHFRTVRTVRRSNPATDAYDAQLVARLDSGERGTEWHRVTADLSLADSGTQVRLRYLATDDGDLEYTDEPGALESVDLDASHTGIGSTYAARLRDAGVRGLSELVEQSPERVASVVTTDVPDVSTARVEDWIDQGETLLADGDGTVPLEAVDGVGPTYAGRLRDAGIEDVAALVDHTPGAVARIVSAGTYDVPVETAASWIQAARRTLASRDDVRGLDWTTLERPDPRDALLTDAEGRYLWIELELVGDRHRTPAVDRFRAYFPRQSYLRDLPAIYREDADSAAFLERFLSIFESVLTDVDEEIESMPRYFDPHGAPPEALSWLGDWIGVEAGETWPEPARRELIDRAPELYRKRGTPDGLLAVLRLYLRHTAAYRDHLGDPDATTGDAASSGSDGGSNGPGAASADASGSADAASDPSGDPASACRHAPDVERPAGQAVYLLEHQDLDCIDDPAVREAYERLVPCPQCFLVLVRSWFDDEAVRTVDRIVEREQPAHAVGNAAQLREGVHLGGNAFLGIDSRLPDREFTVDESGLGQTTVLATREADGELGTDARLGSDTTIS